MRADDKQLFIVVADHEPGIPDDALELVFERFRRIKQGEPDNATLTVEQGSGLGLAVCRGFVVNFDIKRQNLQSRDRVLIEETEAEQVIKERRALARVHR